MTTIVSGSITVVLLMVMCKAINDIVYAIARKRMKTSKLAWILTHQHWKRWLIGGAVAFAASYVMTVSFIDAVRPRPYVAPPELPPVVNTYELEPAPSASSEELVLAKDKEEAKRWAAYAIWYEARGEQRSGRIAVASVLWNRAEHNPENIMAVLQSTNWLGSPEILNPDLADVNCPVYKESWLIAHTMVEGGFQSTGKWTHFYNPAKAQPWWGTQLIAKKKIGRHLFGVLPQ